MLPSRLTLSFAEGDHDSGVDESTQGGNGAVAGGGGGGPVVAAPTTQKKRETSRIPMKTPPQSPTKSMTPSTRAAARQARTTTGYGSQRFRSQSVPKPAFSAFGGTPGKEKKGATTAAAAETKA
jgi:hypothetical protein